MLSFISTSTIFDKKMPKSIYDIKLNDNDRVFNFIHHSEWNSPVQLSKNFTLIKHNSAIQNFNIEINPDIIYFDPFCYRVQPEMWSKKINEEK